MRRLTSWAVSYNSIGPSCDRTGCLVSFMIISKKVEFSASHICRSPELSDAENERVYGAAANPLGHGHNYVVEVAIAGEPDPVTGMILDLKRLKEILEETILSVYDHRLLNREVPPFDRIVPTVENIAIDIWNRLERAYRRDGRAGCIPCGCTRPTNCLSSTGARNDRQAGRKYGFSASHRLHSPAPERRGKPRDLRQVQ